MPTRCSSPTSATGSASPANSANAPYRGGAGDRTRTGSAGNRIARVLFAVEQGEMVLLHAFIKKTQQTPPADIELATQRFKEWQHGQDR